MEDGLGLTSVTGLLAVVTTLTLGEQRSLASLILCAGSVFVWCRSDCGLLTGDLVLGVLLAVLALAVGTAGLGNVDLNSNCQPMSVAGVRCAQRWSRVSVECSISERGAVAMWWRAFGNGRLAVLLELEGGRPADGLLRWVRSR